MKKLLLHTCCGPCAIYVARKLREDFAVTLYFFNPNIHPEDEYHSRLAEIKKWASKDKFKVIEAEYKLDEWFAAVKGLEREPEGGKRCLVCYRFRLQQTAKYAKDNGYDVFTTTLSISPHKKASNINPIGKELEKEYGVEFMEADWKKQDGFKHACEMSKQEEFYRQDYCGCVYSKAQNLNNKPPRSARQITPP